MLSVKEGQYFISGKTRKLIIWKIVASLGFGEMNDYKGRSNSQTLFLLGFLVTAGCSVHHDGDDLSLGSKTVTRITWLDRCWRRNVLVGDYKMLVTVLIVLDTIIQKMSPTSKLSHRHPEIVTNFNFGYQYHDVTNITFTESFDHFCPKKTLKETEESLIPWSILWIFLFDSFLSH